MLFNSLIFAVFLAIVFIIYWFITDKNLTAQNILLLTASYVFYCWWDWRFLVILFLVSLANYFLGFLIEKNPAGRKKKMWLGIGLVINIGILGVFKYYNFFVDSFIDMVSLLGYELQRSTTRIILPVGISFYVFLSLSYILDISKGNLKADRNPVNVLLSLSFFPIILAGPIQRPSTLLPQITGMREFDYNKIADGLRQILWGLFAKVVIADNMSVFADEIFRNSGGYAGSTLFIGAVFYGIQIYADFSGYSNMAIGIAKLLGFNLMRNFANPYFSRDITEFWKRWHISLTTWFRDYLFLPLSFAISWKIKSEKVLLIRSDLFIYILASTVTWFLTGLWHGANYTFIIWGMIHGFFLIVYQWQRDPRKKFLKRTGISNNNRFIVIVETAFTLGIVLIAWIFFRAGDVSHAVSYLSGIFSGSLFSIPHFPNRMIALVITFLTIFFFIVEWLGREGQYGIAVIDTKFPLAARWAVYYTLVTIIFFFAGTGQKYVYFQF